MLILKLSHLENTYKLQLRHAIVSIAEKGRNDSD